MSRFVTVCASVRLFCLTVKVDTLWDNLVRQRSRAYESGCKLSLRRADLLQNGCCARCNLTARLKVAVILAALVHVAAAQGHRRHDQLAAKYSSVNQVIRPKAMMPMRVRSVVISPKRRNNVDNIRITFDFSKLQLNSDGDRSCYTAGAALV